MGKLETIEVKSPTSPLPSSPSDSSMAHSSKSPPDSSPSNEGPTKCVQSLGTDPKAKEENDLPEIGSRQASQSQLQRVWEAEVVEGERKRGFLSSTFGITSKCLAKVFTTKKNRVGSTDRMNNVGTGSCMSSCSIDIEPSRRLVCRSSSESSLPLCHNLLESLVIPDEDLAGSFTSMESMFLREPVSSSVPLYPAILRRNSFGHRLEIIEASEVDMGQESSLESPPLDTMATEPSTSGVAPGPPWDGLFDEASGDSSQGPFIGPKFKFVTSGDVQVSKLKHGQNLLGKLTGSKLLRRWETHHLYLNDMCISSKTPGGPLSTPISYWQIEDVYPVVRWDTGRKHVIHIVLPDGSLLIQTSNAYTREQWYHSIVWKRNIFKYQHLLRSSKRPEILLKGLKALVEYATTTPLHGDYISQVPISIVSNYLDVAGDRLEKTEVEEILLSLSPLLDTTHPPPSLCRFFSRQCRLHPRCRLVGQLFTAVVCRALKHHMKNGFFVEAGAYDGDSRSNTLWLERGLEWEGLLVEPDPVSFALLKSKHRQAWHINFGLSKFHYPVQSKLYRHPIDSGLNSLSRFPDVNKTVLRNSEATIECIPLYTMLLALNRTTVDLLNFDVSGTQFRVLEALPFDKVYFKVVIIDSHLIPLGKLEKFMLSKGFRYFASFESDTVFLHNDFLLEDWNTYP